MTAIESSVRCNQLAEGRFFIYITHQRSGVTLFPSRELSPIGVNKRRLTRGETGASAAMVMIDALIARVKAAGVQRGPIRADQFAPFVAEAAKTAGAQEAVFLKRTAAYSARILVTLPHAK